MNSRIKLVFLDLGGVLFHWKGMFPYVAERYKRSLNEVGEIFARYDPLSLTGKISTWDLWDSVINELRVDSNDTFFDIIAGSFSPIQMMHTFAKELLSILPVGLLTNIHRDLFEFYQQRQLIPSLDFSPIIQSCYIGLKKPDEKIFLYALKQVDLKPHEILFVDDEIKNIEMAKSLGWNALLFNENDPNASIQGIREFLDIATL